MDLVPPGPSVIVIRRARWRQRRSRVRRRGRGGSGWEKRALGLRGRRGRSRGGLRAARNGGTGLPQGPTTPAQQSKVKLRFKKEENQIIHLLYWVWALWSVVLIDDGGHLNIGGCSLVLQTTINISNYRIFEQLCSQPGEKVIFLNNLVNHDDFWKTWWTGNVCRTPYLAITASYSWLFLLFGWTLVLTSITTSCWRNS